MYKVTFGKYDYFDGNHKMWETETMTFDSLDKAIAFVSTFDPHEQIPTIEEIR